MRYFAELSYKGTNYFGWQRQPEQLSVQEVIETAMTTILRQEISVTGCGRTDTGVHASKYFLHFDFDSDFPEAFLRRLNKVLPSDIAIHRIWSVADEAHARFDAARRSYVYHITLEKNPFLTETAYHFPFAADLNIELLEQAAGLLLQYEDFYPFCKSNSDVQHTLCHLMDCRWEYNSANSKLSFHISANRFLRGMVRLIVGMCLNVGMGKTEIEDVKAALDNRSLLAKSWSVPPEGLFLSEVRYKGEIKI